MLESIQEFMLLDCKLIYFLASNYEGGHKTWPIKSTQTIVTQIECVYACVCIYVHENLLIMYLEHPLTVKIPPEKRLILKLAPV